MTKIYIDVPTGATACYVSGETIREGYEFRLVFSERAGFGLQARPYEPMEEWVDVEVMQDEWEVSDVMCKLLGIHLEGNVA
jgi:hypothetical protein